jgi:hypothetical protein
MTSKKVKTVKLAQALPGTDSLLLFEAKWDMEYFPALGVTEVKSKGKTSAKFIVPLTNVAYMVPMDEQEAPKTPRNSKKD